MSYLGEEFGEIEEILMPVVGGPIFE